MILTLPVEKGVAGVFATGVLEVRESFTPFGLSSPPVFSFNFLEGCTTCIVDPSASSSSFGRFLLSRSFALGLGGRPALLFFGLAGSTAAAGVGGTDPAFVLNLILKALFAGAGVGGAGAGTSEGGVLCDGWL